MLEAINFEELQKIDCSKYIEKKGKFSYLSWPYMVRQLRLHEPKATIHARINPAGLPYFRDESGGLVETYILLDDKEVWNEWLPIMDFKNKALKNPDAMDINKAIQRCKAKCISEYTGIGLYIYMGEDLPDNEQDVSKPKQEKQPLKETKLTPFMEDMKGYVTNEPNIYWKVMGNNGFEKATDIPTNKQAKVLKEMADMFKEV